jgi:hypothetical protein
VLGSANDRAPVGLGKLGGGGQLLGLALRLHADEPQHHHDLGLGELRAGTEFPTVVGDDRFGERMLGSVVECLGGPRRRRSRG